MRVLFIAFDSGELSVRMASGLAQHAEVCLMLPQAEAEPHMRWLNRKVNFQPFDKPRLREPLKQILLMPNLVKRIKQFNPDVIHFQKGHTYFNLTLPFLRQYPLVVSIHDPRRHLGDTSAAKMPQPIMDFAYRRADHVIAHNEPMKQEIIRALNISEEKITITALIQRGDDSAGGHVEEAGHEILFFGRIWGYKGLQDLIRAEPLITAEVPEAKIVIAGEGENFEKYRNLMCNPGNFIVHNEFVSYEKQAELFRRSSVVVLPYLEATQSGVIPIAYTFEKPVVATDVGGLESQVDDGRTGYLVTPGDCEELAATIVRLLKDPQLRQRMGAEGKRKLKTEWSGEAVARQTIPAYELAIAAARSRLGKTKQLAKVTPATAS